MLCIRRSLCVALLSLASSTSATLAQNLDNGNLDALPKVAEGFEIRFVAKEPLTRNPCAMSFDYQGRLFVGMGPQYRSPQPDTPGDSVFILRDTDGDGCFDEKHQFATGLNNIQGLCWHGKDLWIANAPDLTIVQDTDGDDIADKYHRIYTDLGNLEHGLHGLTWGPDGRMYMSKGNSKGHNGPELFAPEPFRELSGVPAPAGTPIFPQPRISGADDYLKTYHDPADDWGREGGILSCKDMGHELRIESRGYRNPWDIAFDHEFNFVGTDNDQDLGDRVFHSFYGAHYGWGHPWSAEWRCENHLPTPNLVGPLFGGSGTGMTYFNSPAFPPELRGVWMFNDWLQRRTHYFHAAWKGAQLTIAEDNYNTLVSGGEALFKPTDLEVGPDGALYILGWGREYGAQWDTNQRQVNEGRIFQITWRGNQAQTQLKEDHERWNRPLSRWNTTELIDGLDDLLAVRRVAAQEELIRRKDAPATILGLLEGNTLSVQQTTWALWALIRCPHAHREHLPRFTQLLISGQTHQRIQALRCLGDSLSQPKRVNAEISLGVHVPTVELLKTSLTDDEARIRFSAYQFITTINNIPPDVHDDLLIAISAEPDATCFYAAWHVLKRHYSVKQLRTLLEADHPRLQLAALLALAELASVPDTAVKRLLKSESPALRETAALWETRSRGNSMFYISHPGGEFTDSVSVSLLSYLKPSQIYYTLDGSTPNRSSPRWPGRINISRTCTLKAAVYLDNRQIGRIAEFQYSRISRKSAAERQGILSIQPTTNRLYQISNQRPQQGVKPYTDRPYEITTITEGLVDSVLLRTPNDDSDVLTSTLVTIELAIPTTVHIAHDKRIQAPKWLQSWNLTDQSLSTTDTTFTVYKRVVPAGKLELGANRDSAQGAASQYLILLNPGNLTQLKVPTTLAAATRSMNDANYQRGKALFFATGGAGCYKCHLASENNADAGFGPNLAFLKSQRDVNHIVESILNPSAKIKEGFATQVILTSDGKMFSGILQKETGESLFLNRPDGQTVILDRTDIEQRFSQKNSAMPAYDRLLTPQQTADLVKFLLAQ